MVKIGINENVFISNISKSEEGTLIITLDNPTNAAQEAVSVDKDALKAALEHNPFADWEEGGESFNESMSSGLQLRIFNIDADPKRDTPDVLPTAEEMRKRLDTLRDPLTHIMLGYITREQNPLKPTVIFRGTGIDTDFTKFPTLIMSEEVLGRIYANIVDAFIETMRPFVGNEELLFRVRLPRQSKKKAFATFPTKFIGPESPFWESMQIPKEASKMKWSNYELKNGLNLDTPYAGIEEADTSNNNTVAQEEPQDDPFAAR